LKEQIAPRVDQFSTALISSGAQGFHPLFETPSIRRAFANIEHGLISEEGLLLAHKALRVLLAQQSVSQMKTYLGSLPEPVVDLLVFLYFRILDQFIEESEPTIH